MMARVGGWFNMCNSNGYILIEKMHEDILLYWNIEVHYIKNIALFICHQPYYFTNINGIASPKFIKLNLLCWEKKHIIILNRIWLIPNLNQRTNLDEKCYEREWEGDKNKYGPLHAHALKTFNTNTNTYAYVWRLPSTTHNPNATIIITYAMIPIRGLIFQSWELIVSMGGSYFSCLGWMGMMVSMIWESKCGQLGCNKRIGWWIWC